MVGTVEGSPGSLAVAGVGHFIRLCNPISGIFHSAQGFTKGFGMHLGALLEAALISGRNKECAKDRWLKGIIP